MKNKIKSLLLGGIFMWQNDFAIAASNFWPNKAKLVISISMQFEAGGQPEGAQSPFSPLLLPKETRDMVAHTWFDYGAKEGIYRMLNLWDKHKIKVTSHIVGAAAIAHPEIVQAIFNRGHEAASHGMNWSPQYLMSYKEELSFVKDGMKAIFDITGVNPLGHNCYWMERSKNTLKVLQEAGMIYHIDDLSRDEPFISLVNAKPFVTVPYTLRNNDIALIEGKNFSAQQFLDQLKMEFDQLYEEGVNNRRMMSISLHDRIGGTPAVVNAMDQFLSYAKSKKGVVFMRKDDIAKMVLAEKSPLIDKYEDKFNNKNKSAK